MVVRVIVTVISAFPVALPVSLYCAYPRNAAVGKAIGNVVVCPVDFPHCF